MYFNLNRLNLNIALSSVGSVPVEIRDLRVFWIDISGWRMVAVSGAGEEPLAARHEPFVFLLSGQWLGPHRRVEQQQCEPSRAVRASPLVQSSHLYQPEPVDGRALSPSGPSELAAGRTEPWHPALSNSLTRHLETSGSEQPPYLTSETSGPEQLPYETSDIRRRPAEPERRSPSAPPRDAGKGRIRRFKLQLLL